MEVGNTDSFSGAQVTGVEGPLYERHWFHGLTESSCFYEDGGRFGYSVSEVGFKGVSGLLQGIYGASAIRSYHDSLDGQLCCLEDRKDESEEDNEGLEFCSWNGYPMSRCDTAFGDQDGGLGGIGCVIWYPD